MFRHEEKALREYVLTCDRLRAAEAEGARSAIRAAAVAKASAMAQIAIWMEARAREALGLRASDVS